MAQIPTTNIELRREIRGEYGGNSTNVSLSNYYRSLNNSAFVDNSAVIPYDPKAILNTYYSGQSIYYARKITIIRNAITLQYVPNTNITREYFYGSSVPFATTVTQNDPGANPSAPGSFYGNTADYFYFSPDTNYPWAGQSTSIAQVFVAQNIIAVPAYNALIYENWYSLWRTLASAAYTAYYNKTVPTGGQISMGDFKNQFNP